MNSKTFKTHIIALALGALCASSAFFFDRIVCMPNTTPSTQSLLQAPETVSPNALATLTKESLRGDANFTMGMPWGFDYFKYENGKVAWGVEYYESTLPDGLTAEEKALFTTRECGEGDAATRCCLFRCGDPEPTFALNTHGKRGLESYKPVTTQKQYGYNFAANRGTKDDAAVAGKYQELFPKQIAQILANKTFIFYTGAGISVNSGVDSAPQLQEKTGIKGDGFLEQLRERIKTAQAIVDHFRNFFNAAFTAPATDAHIALAKIAHHKQCQVITENFDLLHERSGIKPYKMLSQGVAGFDTDFGINSLSNIDAIICLGMRHDNRGLLAKYKELRPNGIIVAFDLKRPQFIIEKEDILVKGNLQQTFPIFVEQMISQHDANNGEDDEE